MIPESAGATPFGIFQLADAFRLAAQETAGKDRKLTSGPTRLLAYHACELFLKAYLREHGQGVEALRANPAGGGATLGSGGKISSFTNNGTIAFTGGGVSTAVFANTSPQDGRPVLSLTYDLDLWVSQDASRTTGDLDAPQFPKSFSCHR